MGKVEDEMHMMMECPMYSQYRTELYTKLGYDQGTNVTDANMKELCNGRRRNGWQAAEHWKAIASYIGKCYNMRESVLGARLNALN